MKANAGGEVVELVSSWFFATTLAFVVVLIDERRLGERNLANAWPKATRDLVLVYFGAVALPFHFCRTRGTLGSLNGLLRKAAGLALGTALGVAVLALTSLAVECVDALFSIS